MKKLCCMLALAAFSCGTVLASGVAVKASTMQTDTVKKKMNKKHMKSKKKGMRDTTKMRNDTMKMRKDTMKMK